MILVSSMRALGDDAECDANQLNAKLTWEDFATRIYYVNPPEPLFDSPKTEFVLTQEKFPFIKELVVVAAQATGWCALVNADICLSPALKHAQAELEANGARAAISRRYEFDPQAGPAGFTKARVVDLGLDFFAAVPSVWKQVATVLPPAFRIGHQQWDTWLLGWLCANVRQFWDLTPCRLVHHPKHGGRRFECDTTVDRREFKPTCWPSKILTQNQLYRL